ncbi:MAG: rane protein [Planctomycetota bacterium]
MVGARAHDAGGPLPLGWGLFAIVLVACFPLHPYWQSDDFVAVAYASDAGRAFSDFAGNQYGLEGVVWFYRPLVTVSFWFEQALAGGPNPALSHIGNAVTHAIGAVLLGAIAARLLGPMRGWLAGLAWGLSPSHAGAIFWAAGRVDSHTVVWLALACLLQVRAVRRQGRGRGLALLALLAALCTKEHAVIAPVLFVMLALTLGRQGQRVRGVVQTWPAFVLVAAYLGVRHLLFGRIGGYDAAATQDLPGQLMGLGSTTLTLLNPLRRLGGSVAAIPTYVELLGYVPALLAVGQLIHRRRFRVLAGCVVAYGVLALPAFPFWTQQGVESLRYSYFPFAALALLLAAGGPIPVLASLAVFALPTVEQHRDWFAAYADVKAHHQALLEDRDTLPPGPIFVAGLPRQNERRTVVEFHLGVDRLLQPPFVDRDARRVLALRPLTTRADARTIPYGTSTGLPFRAPTLRFDGADARAMLPPAEVADLLLEGPTHLPTEQLGALNEGKFEATIHTRGVRAARFRVTIFTGGGYLTAEVPDVGRGADGAINLRDVLVARHVLEDGADQEHVLFALAIATTFDLDTSFPILIEALDPDGTATHANRRPFLLGFDRALFAFTTPR